MMLSTTSYLNERVRKFGAVLVPSDRGYLEVARVDRGVFCAALQQDPQQCATAHSPEAAFRKLVRMLSQARF